MRLWRGGAIPNKARRYRSELLPRRGGLGLAVAVGAICGLLNAIYAISYVGLAFPGGLASAAAPAIGLGLLGTALTGFVVAVGLRYPGAMAVISPEATLVIGSVASGLAATVAPERLAATVLAVLALVTCLTALALVAVGRLRLGYLMHYLPYPVIAGLMGGLGVLLVGAGLEMVAPRLTGWSDAISAQHGVEILLAAGVGTLLWIVHHRWPSEMVLPAILLAGMALFWVSAGAISEPQAWLLGPYDDAAIARPETIWRSLAGADWTAIAGHAPTLAMLVVFMVVLVLADIASLEVALGEQLEPDQSLRTIGVANAVSGCLAGVPVVMSISATVIAHRSRAACRAVGLVAGLVALGFYLAGPRPLELVPAFVVGGLIVFIGLEFVASWIVLRWRRLNGADRAILLAVVAGVSLAGFAEGFVIGLLLGFVLFVVSCSRLPPIRHETTGRYRFSHVDRPETDRDALRVAGDSRLVLELGGFLFFGSAWRVFDRVQQRALQRRAPALRAVLLDFRRVNGVDSSGWHNFRKIAELGLQHGFEVVLSHLTAGLERSLRIEGIAGGLHPNVHIVQDLDRGLELLEASALAPAATPGLAEAPATFAASWPDALQADGLAAFVERRWFAAGEPLIRQGEDSDDVYIIRAGWISVVVNRPDGERIRLRRAGPGTVVGEIAFILRRPRTAWAIADTPVEADRLTSAAVARMAKEDPTLLLRLQTAMLRILARRVSDSTELIVQLSR